MYLYPHETDRKEIFYILTTVITFFRRLCPRHFLQTSMPPAPLKRATEYSSHALHLWPTLGLLVDDPVVLGEEIVFGFDSTAPISLTL